MESKSIISFNGFKRSLKKSLKVFGLSFFIGFLIWSMLFRVVKLQDGSDKTYAVVLLNKFKVGDDVIFRYPFYTGPYAKSTLSKNSKTGQLEVTVGESDLIVVTNDDVKGKILFNF